jgi:hypothetical protein
MALEHQAETDAADLRGQAGLVSLIAGPSLQKYSVKGM